MVFFSLQTMSVDDFATTLAYLIRVCWSASAGQLHLASIGDSQPPSPSQHSSQPQTTMQSTMQLREGICAQQEPGSVGAKVLAISTSVTVPLHYVSDYIICTCIIVCT